MRRLRRLWVNTRQIETQVDVEPLRLAEAFVGRVAGDGVLGVARHHFQPDDNLAAGLAVLAALVVLAVIVQRTHGWQGLVLPGLLLGLSLAALAALAALAMPLMLTEIDVHNPGTGRYHVAPAMFLLACAGFLAERTVVALLTWRTPIAVLLGALPVGLLCCVVFGITSSARVEFMGHESGPSWADGVERGRVWVSGTTGGAPTPCLRRREVGRPSYRAV